MRAIFLRELGRLSRQPTTLLGLTALLVSLTGVLAALWPSSLSLRPEDVSVLGEQAWTSAQLVLLVGMSLLAPALGASALSSERQGQTLSLLLIAGVHPLGLALAKALSRFAMVSLVSLLPLPMLVALATLGGVEVSQALGCQAVLLGLGFFGVCVGILFSAIFDDTSRALFSSYLVVLLPFSAPSIGQALGVAPPSSVTARLHLWEALVSPLRAMDFLMDPSCVAGAGESAGAVWVQPAAGLVLSLLALLASWPLTVLAGSGRWGRRGAVRSGLLSRWDLIGRLIRARSDNPILWRESATAAASRFEGARRLGFYGAVLVLGLLVVELFPELRSAMEAVASNLPGTDPDGVKLHGAVTGILLFFMVLAVSVGAATALAAERDSGLLQQLAVTPLSFSVFAWGKALGALEQLGLLIVLPAVYLLGLALLGEQSLSGFIIVSLALLPMAGFAVIQGLYCGLVAKSATRAMVTALSLVILSQPLSFCWCLSFSPLLLGYNTVLQTSRSASLGDEVGLFLIVCASVLVQGFALKTLARWLEDSFDRFLGRTAAMELALVNQ